MERLDQIRQRAADRHGEAVLNERLSSLTVRSPAELAALTDDRWLAEMTRCVFQAGFVWKVIDAKWAGFEAAFAGFDPNSNAAMDDEVFDRLLKDARIVRHAKKILSVRDNARFLVDLALDNGSAARFFSDWPDEDFIGLIAVLKARASRLSGETAMRFFRYMGKPSFITSPDVTAALISAGVVTGPVKSRRDQAAVQAAFNQWRDESGLDLTRISRILAMSQGAVMTPRTH
jgi:3-methyladenine DNA glycosylase Tag